MSENIKSMQMTFGKSFFKKMDLISTKMGEAVKTKATEIVSEAVDLSPVDTGAFVESWQVNPRGDRTARSRTSAGRPRLSEGAKQAKREEEKSRLIGRVASFDTEKLDGFTLINRAPHLEFIEGNPRIKEPFKRPSEIGAILKDKHS